VFAQAVVLPRMPFNIFRSLGSTMHTRTAQTGRRVILTWHISMLILSSLPSCLLDSVLLLYTPVCTLRKRCCAHPCLDRRNGKREHTISDGQDNGREVAARYEKSLTLQDILSPILPTLRTQHEDPPISTVSLICLQDPSCHQPDARKERE